MKSAAVESVSGYYKEDEFSKPGWCNTIDSLEYD